MHDVAFGNPSCEHSATLTAPLVQTYISAQVVPGQLHFSPSAVLDSTISAAVLFS